MNQYPDHLRLETAVDATTEPEDELPVPFDLQQALMERANPSWNKWTTPELTFLHRYYPVVSPAIIARVLRRSISSVHSKANDLGIRGNRDAVWTPEMKAQFCHHYPILGARATTRMMKLTLKQAYNAARRYKVTRHRLWSQREQELARAALKIVAAKTGRSLWSVAGYMARLAQDMAKSATVPASGS